MRMLCDKHSKGYLRRAPYQKNKAEQQAHKTETLAVCAHHPPMLDLLKTRNIIIGTHIHKQLVHLLLDRSSCFDRGMIIKLNADITVMIVHFQKFE